MLLLNWRFQPRSIIPMLIFFCSAHPVLADTAQLEDDKVFLTVKEWNEKYCTTEGCKLMTDAMFAMSNNNNHTRFDMIRRNTAFRDPLFQSAPTEPAPLEQDDSVRAAVPYLGIMVDAGSHYFPLDWIRNLLHYMKLLNFNLLHLRLTSDLAFRVQLEGSAKTAKLASSESYTAQELRDLVALADTLGIKIMPEVSVPAQAGGWAIPGMIVPCPSIICHKLETSGAGGGLPLNFENPDVTSIVTKVLQEIVSIFHTSPFLHLGSGLRDFVTVDCLDEANQDVSSFERHANDFELHLQDTFHDKKQIVRWESNALENEYKGVKRTVDILHQQSRHPPTGDAVTTAYFSTPNVLDFKENNVASASEIFNSTRALVNKQRKDKPLAILVSTLHLDLYQWMDRNVMGRLVAVAMGASSQTKASSLDMDTYLKLCRTYLQDNEAVCDLKGLPILSEFLYQSAMNDQQEKVWPGESCSRLTTRKMVRHLQGRSSNNWSVVRDATTNFWNRLGEESSKFVTALHTNIMTNATAAPFLQNIDDHKVVPYRGILLDLARIDRKDGSMARIFKVLETMYFLGLNTLQLRIMSDLGFVAELPSDTHGKDLLFGSDHTFSKMDLSRIVKHATSLGIHIIPEISTATRGGGWFAAGLLAGCPNVMCSNNGVGVVAVPDIKQSLIILTVSVIHELLEIFPQAPFIHLGYDERAEAKACYDEAGMAHVDLDDFERRLIKTLDFQNLTQAKLIRWENAEGVLYPNRAGHVTHYRLMEPAAVHVRIMNPEDVKPRPFFLSSGLNFAQPSQELNVWTVYQHTRKLQSQHPMGIIAIVDLVHESFWRDFEIEKNLVAFAMSLSSLSHHRTKTEFHQELDATLRKIQAEKEQAPINKDAAAEHLKKHWASRVERSCSERTVRLPKVLPKQGVLV